MFEEKYYDVLEKEDVTGVYSLPFVNLYLKITTTMECIESGVEETERLKSWVFRFTYRDTLFHQLH